jgi:hypothetical protein
LEKREGYGKILKGRLVVENKPANKKSREKTGIL